MKKLIKTIIAGLLLCSLFSLTSLAEPLADVYVTGKAGPSSTGWMQSGDNWKYMNAGAAVRGWAEIGPKWYYFDESGNMATGWKDIGGVKYYFAESSTAGSPKGSWVESGTVPQAATPAETPAGPGSEAAPVPEVPVNPYGHTCVEVNLSAQTIRVWQGETLYLESPCVTGYKGVHDTSAGNFRIQSMETDRYLQGYNDNGTKYKSYVNYWMPFNGGQGLHDANWRGTAHENFGGQIYVTDGSHGCVNLPYDVAEALYSIAYVGMPVHTHY